MRVLQVCKFYPPVLGGIETVAWELAEGLRSRGVAMDILCSNQWPRTLREVTRSGCRVWRAARIANIQSTSIAPTMPRLLSRLARASDVVHVHMPDPMAAAAIWLARPRARLVVHWHSDVVRQRRALRLYEPLQRWLLERADAIVATSAPYAAASNALALFGQKVHIVPIGVSDNHSDACRLRAAEIRAQHRGRVIIFALGRMTYYKGFEVLIEAASRLPPNVLVLVGGDGELLERHRREVASRGLIDRIRFLGHLPDDDLPSYFEACDVFCMPSTLRAEAYGVAIVEAMVMGRPVVASDIEGSGVPWVNLHGQTGFNVPVRDAAALAHVLGRLAADPSLRERLGAEARKRYEREFDGALMVDRMLTLYRSLHGGTPAARRPRVN